ncbi:hypothetical protein L195_g003702 [Trifolium pratense]|uniref:Uncharacterized protein n=1 Tax=Trifolium pratense TaxID=57577 RepID=A0A2K3NW15_TRIPR|nr:hypothetical protein L195_g003702 [Trifolium pratense]
MDQHRHSHCCLSCRVRHGCSSSVACTACENHRAATTSWNPRLSPPMRIPGLALRLGQLPVSIPLEPLARLPPDSLVGGFSPSQVEMLVVEEFLSESARACCQVVTPVVAKHQHIEKVEPLVPQVQAETSQETGTSHNPPPKVDFATDLFDMLSMDDPNEKGSVVADASADDDNNWAAAAETSTAEKTDTRKSVESTPQPTSGIEDLFNDSSSVTPSSALEKPQKDVKNDIMSLFEKNNIVSPFAMHQQQLAMLAQQQSLLMAAAAAKSSSEDAKYPANVQQPGLNIPIQSWPAASYPIPGVMHVGSQGDLQKLMQTMNMTSAYPAESSVQYPPSSYFTTSQVAPVNGTTTTAASKPQSATPVSSNTTNTVNDYDFSSLTQGMFAKP